MDELTLLTRESRTPRTTEEVEDRHRRQVQATHGKAAALTGTPRPSLINLLTHYSPVGNQFVTTGLRGHLTMWVPHLCPRLSNGHVVMQLENQGEIDHSVLDSLFRCLAHPCRRAILRRLRESRRGQTSVDELAEYVTAEGAARSTDDPETAGMKLYHTHLPMLAEKGLVEYDRARGTVSPTPRLAQIEAYLELVPTFDRYDAPAGADE